MARGVGKLTGWRVGETMRVKRDCKEITKPSETLPAGTLVQLGCFHRVQDGVECWTVWHGNTMSWGVCSEDMEPCQGPVQRMLPPWWNLGR